MEMVKNNMPSVLNIKIPLTFILIFLGVSSFSQNTYPFKLGEKMHYTMHYGWFKIGEAQVWIDKDYKVENDISYLNVQCDIKTASWFKLFSKLRIHFESLVRVDNLQPYTSYRNLTDGKDKDIRHDTFLFREDSVNVDAYIEDIDKWRYHTFENTDAPLLDAMSTYLWLRSRDDKVLMDEVTVRTFFTNKLYEFKTHPKASTTYKYKKYAVEANEFELVFPEGEYFDKGKTGSVLLSNDGNKIPLKFEIDMTVGSFSFELQDYESGS